MTCEVPHYTTITGQSYFLPLGPKYSSQHPVSECPHSTLPLI